MYPDVKDTHILLSWGRWSLSDFFSPPLLTFLLSSRESSLLWPGKAECPGGGQAEPPWGYRHSRVCSWRALQTSAMPPVDRVLLVCPSGHGTPPAWYFHSVRAIGLVRCLPGEDAIKKPLLLYWICSYFYSSWLCATFLRTSSAMRGVPYWMLLCTSPFTA